MLKYYTIPTITSKFQFNQDRGPRRKPAKADVTSSRNVDFFLNSSRRLESLTQITFLFMLNFTNDEKIKLVATVAESKLKKTDA